MRIALVVPRFPQLSETFVVAKALGLVERGLDVHIVCADSAADRWAHFGTDHPVHTLRPRVHTTVPVAPRWALPARLVAQSADLVRRSPGGLRRALRAGAPSQVARHLVVDAPVIELDPEVVHFEFGAQAVGREQLGDRLDCAMTVSFRGSDLAYMGLETAGFYDRLWREVDGVHVLGSALWRRAVLRGAPEDLPHITIAPAIDLAQVPVPHRDGTPAGTSARPLRVLSVGRLHWTKGYDDALEAVSELRRRGVVVEHRIVGQGELLQAVSFWRHQLGLDDVVDLLGAVAPAEVAAHYRWGDVLLHSAISEGFCNAVVEAQAHGMPVVCTDAGGLPENVDDGVTGIVAPRRDPHALADGLAALAAGGDLRSRMGAAGRERVGRLFRLDDQLDAWERFYADAVARRSTRGRS